MFENLFGKQDNKKLAAQSDLSAKTTVLRQLEAFKALLELEVKKYNGVKLKHVEFDVDDLKDEPGVVTFYIKTGQNSSVDLIAEDKCLNIEAFSEWVHNRKYIGVKFNLQGDMKQHIVEFEEAVKKMLKAVFPYNKIIIKD